MLCASLKKLTFWVCCFCLFCFCFGNCFVCLGGFEGWAGGWLFLFMVLFIHIEFASMSIYCAQNLPISDLKMFRAEFNR